MVRSVLLTFLLVVSLTARADDYFRFFRISCDAQIPSFELEQKGYWNISHVAANHADRAAHVRSLKRLEREQGLYVFDEFWGYYDKPQVSFSCGSIKATLTSKSFTPRTDNGTPLHPVRVDTRLAVSASGEILVQDLALSSGTPIDVLRVYGDNDSHLMIQACSGGRCIEEFAHTLGAFTSEMAYERLSPKDDR